MRLPRSFCRLGVLLSVVFLAGPIWSARAAYSLTTGIGTGVDEDVNEMSPTDTTGGRAFLELRSRNIAGTERHLVAYLRFDLSGVTKPIDAASLRFWIASSQRDADAFAFDVYGVADGVAGENDWSASTLSYNSAPGMAAGDYPDIDRDHEPGQLVHLGDVTYPGGNQSLGLTMSSQALLDFINADTNDVVTLVLEPQVAATGQDFFVRVCSFEGVGSDAGDFAPTLYLPNTTPPDEAPPPPTDAVFLNETSGEVTVGNGIVRAVFTKTTGECRDLRFEGGTNLLLNGGRLYFDSNSGGAYHAFTGATYSLVENTGQRVHVKFASRMGEFATELHYVLQVGEAGVHCYTIFRHGAGDAATYLEQARMVLRCDKNVFTEAFTSEQKTGQMIAPSLLAGATEIMDATLQLPASSSYTTPTGTTDAGLPVYTKYDWADFVETHKAHGLAGDSTGLWMLSGSEEGINGGPTKGELFIHGTDTTPLMIATFHAAHFVGSDSNLQLAAGEVWEKIYGPYFIYLNREDDAGAQALWADALARADEEKEAWPPAWMNEAAFPVARGAVSGRLIVDGAPAANALMVLAQPGSDWQAQGRGYIFWTRTDAAGGFTIPKVRPGSYSLYACAPGFSGQMELANVNVAAGATNQLGRLSWTPPRRAQTLWQIGTPDRSAAEFRHGDQMRQFGLWWRYLEERGTADLDYTVGVSDPATDWYYAQSVMALDSGAYLTPKWNVNFSLASVPSGTAELVIDFAGAMNSTLNLRMNGTSIGSFSTVNDAGIYRSATRLSRYRQQRVTFSASLLRAGANTLSFQLNGRSNWSGTKPVSPASGVMYDAIRLEVGAAQPEVLVVEPEEPTAEEVFEAWAATGLPEGSDRSFAGDADGDGVANGFAFAYGEEAVSGGLLQVRVIDGAPTAVWVLAPTENGAAHTSLTVEATRDLADWTGGAVALTESLVGGERRWTPVTGGEAKVFYRAVLRLEP